ncbi:unnamed protein product [Mytilus coruscus]|uniref:Uncharacterized protein n=1 Tax=Mytilus coruscus TaxID=42192 RepID=A0A6J8ANH7_MYTCO|nr:unnamed protein product [Mytilus coruscus]
MDPGEEEDDFGDFGGFEVAEPVPPNVTQVEASSVEASPSPWAVFAAGSSPGNVKPDLLCGQNRFPPVLDPSVPSSSADIIQNGDTNNSNEGSSINTDRYDGTSGDQNGNLEDAILANDILDGSFKSTSSQHSSSGATAADLIRTVNLETTNRIQTFKNDSQSVDLVGDLLGASPGIVLVEDENLENNYLDLGESNGPLVQNRKSADRPTPLHISVSESSGQCKTIDTDGMNPLSRLPASPSGSCHSSESHHMSSPILIDSLRKALHPKATVDVTKLSHKQVLNTTFSTHGYIIKETVGRKTGNSNKKDGRGVKLPNTLAINMLIGITICHTIVTLCIRVDTKGSPSVTLGSHFVLEKTHKDHHLPHFGLTSTPNEAYYSVCVLKGLTSTANGAYYSVCVLKGLTSTANGAYYSVCVLKGLTSTPNGAYYSVCVLKGLSSTPNVAYYSVCVLKGLSSTPNVAYYSVCVLKGLSSTPNVAYYSVCVLKGLTSTPNVAYYSVCVLKDLTSTPNGAYYSVCVLKGLTSTPNVAYYSVCVLKGLTSTPNGAYYSVCVLKGLTSTPNGAYYSVCVLKGLSSTPNGAYYSVCVLKGLTSTPNGAYYSVCVLKGLTSTPNVAYYSVCVLKDLTSTPNGAYYVFCLLLKVVYGDLLHLCCIV